MSSPSWWVWESLSGHRKFVEVVNICNFFKCAVPLHKASTNAIASEKKGEIVSCEYIVLVLVSVVYFILYMASLP